MNIKNCYSWSECVAKEMHWGLEKPLLTHWLLHQTIHDPPLISGRFFKHFEVSESTKINHMHSIHRPMIRFQGIVHLKFNKWTTKILKNINRKNSTWCAELVRKQEIIFFFLCCTTKAKKIEYAKTKLNTTEFKFFYCNWYQLRKHQKIKVKNTCKNQFKRRNQIIYLVPDENTVQWEKDDSCTSKRLQKQANYFELNSFSNV